MAVGYKTGGRVRGTLNKRTQELQALAEGMPQDGTPLAFLMSVFQNPGIPINLRIDAAARAAPFVHPRLSAATLKGDEESPLQVVTQINLVPVEPEPREAKLEFAARDPALMRASAMGESAMI